MFADDVRTRAQHQVKGVPEQYFSAACRDFLGRHAFDGAIRADRHEGWRLHGAAAKAQHTASRETIAVFKFKFQATASGVKNMLSP